MSEYSGTSPHDTYMGDLVYRAKYADAPIREREEAAEEIALRMMSFIDYAYGRESPPFSACITASSHNPKPLELAIYLCARIRDAFDLEDWTGLLRDSSPIKSVKTLTGAKDRYRAVRRSITVTRTGMRRANGGLLFVDDVFQTELEKSGICSQMAALSGHLTHYSTTE